LDYGFLALWQFRVRPGMEDAFLRIYGPEGDWARLFKSGEGYLGTELNRNLSDQQVYVTLDFWSSEEAYNRFRKANAAAYKEIDARCESLTESEVELGRFMPAKAG
jgi:heme-degrading monooxygenase HmoA